MASKRVRKPPVRYVDDVESPFVHRMPKSFNRLPQQNAEFIDAKECGDSDEKTKFQQSSRTDIIKMTADNNNISSKGKHVRKTGRKSRKKSSINSKRLKSLSMQSDVDREKPDFYSSSSDVDLEMCSLSSEDKTFDLPDSSVEDFYEEDEDFQMCSEGSREPALSVASSSVLEDIPTFEKCCSSHFANAFFKVCPWIEISSDRLPRLDLPSGSKDLLINESLLFDVLEIYETCRNYYRTIRLSPFLFEDFCAALISEEQSLLLAEVHIAFLKLALKSDEEEQVTLSVQDTNNSFNIITHLIEPMTYAEVLRQYVESDMKRFPSEVLNALNGNYPFVDVKRRITVLSWLCDRFLHSADFRSIVKNDGKFNSDEYCRECGKQGDVLLCDGCEACYHLNCANLETVPEGQWFCQVCVLHQITGVTDSDQLSSRSQRLPFRLNPLGYDRHGRRYWFAVRRIIVQDDVDNSITYYSTLPQLHSLLSRFAVGDLEKQLSATIMNLLPIINEEMRKTQQLTENSAVKAEYCGETYLVSENLDRMAEIFTRPLACTSFESDDERTLVFLDGKSVEISKTMLLTRVEELLGFKDGLFTELFWTAGLSAEKVLARRNNKDLDRAVASLATENDQQPDINSYVSFRLGEDGAFRAYQNQYTVNDYAKTPLMRIKERDRKKYLCNRFSLADGGNFEWNIPKGKYLYGSESDMISIIQYTLYNFSQRIPPVLMHRLWSRDGIDDFNKRTLAPTATVEELRDLLLRFECGIRKPVMASVFWGTLGHTRLVRLTAEDREAKQMVDAKKKKMDRELVVADADDEDSDVIWVKYTKLGGAPKHNIWRLKDEQYRVNGRGGLSGWLWVSRLLHRDIRQLPEKPPLGINSSTTLEEVQSLSARKAFRLAKLADKLLQWRLNEHEESIRAIEKTVHAECYSPECRAVCITSCGKRNLMERCYSYTCRQQQYKNCAAVTSGCVHAQNQAVSYRTKQMNDNCCRCVLGEDKPFPLPLPFNFSVKRTGEQSLLVLPQKFLRRLARQGGLKPDSFAPGFHRIAKSNAHVWNYPCQRPLFDHCWRYLTLRARSYHAIALQLRILYACIRWGDMERDDDEEERVTIHHPDHDEVRIVVGHKEFPPDGLYERYKLKVQLIPLEDPNDVLDETGEDEEGYRPGRSLDITRSSRKRRVVTKVRDIGHNGIRNTSKMKVVEKWIDGVELKLWEIIAYWKNQQASCSTSQILKGIIDQPHQIISSRLLSRRRPQPKRLADYDYDFEDEDVEFRKQIKHERAPAILRSREGAGRKDLRESQQSTERISVNCYEKSYPSQRPHMCRRLSSYSSGNSELYASESPFNPKFRMRCRVMTTEDVETNEMPSAREAGCLRGGGKGLQSAEDLEQPAASVSPPSTSEDPVQPGSRSPIDEPPLIPRYDNNNYDEVVNGTRDHSETRAPPYQQRRIIYSSPSTSGASLRPLASKVLMIRRADGTTQFLRPIAQSSSKDDRGQTRTVITTAQVGGSTMSEARGGMGLSNGGQRVIPSSSVFTARQFSNRSLVDHAGLVQQRRIVPTIRGRSPYGHTQTRIVRIAPSSGSQPSTSSNMYSTGSQVRVQQSSLGNGVIIAEKDPFVKRMGMEKSINGSQVIYTGSPNTNIRRRANGRDTYAGYYGEKSNDRIDVEEYQMLAERGYRPPGRPPGRLASTFGYGPRVNQQRAILLSRGGHGGNGGGITTHYGADGTVMMSSTSTRYDSGATRMVHSPNRGITTIGTFSGGQYRMRNVATYKEYCLRKGIEWSGDRFRRQLTRPVRFEFESNEEEERAIAEAIAKEEELMRLEEEHKKLAMGVSVEHDTARYGEDIRRKELIGYREFDALRVSSIGNRRLEENLTIREYDSIDTVQIKQVLNELVMQVCRWDKDYNWHKTLLKKAKEQSDADRFYRSHRTLKSRQKQIEIDLNERMDRFRREVNKRRMKLESKVEMEMGMAVPWRRPRGRPNKAVRQQYMAASSQSYFNANVNSESVAANLPVKKEMKTEVEDIPTLIDPAAISLSDTFCSVQSLNGGKAENTKSESVCCEHDPKIDSDVQNGMEKIKDKTKDKKKITEYSKKGSALNQNLNSIQRGRGRPRKDADETLLKPCSSSSSSTQMIKLDGSLPSLPANEISASTICICNKTIDPKAFFITCNTCHRYFHGKCMSISEKKWNKLKQWTCPECLQLNPKDEALYCICRTPYDDSQFYVGCDRCEGWYHLQCVGITQAEAEAMKEYICPNCKNNEQTCNDSAGILGNASMSGVSSLPIVLTRKDYDLIGQLLNTLSEQQASWPFKEKTDEKMFPDYYEKIKNPIDLSAIDNKIERLQYQRLDEFLADIKQMFQNARLYHPKASAIFRCANTLEKKFDSCFAKVKRQIELRNRERLRVSESRTADSLDINTDELFQMGSDFDASILDDII